MTAPQALQILVNGNARTTLAANIEELARELSPAPARLLIEHNGRALLRSEWPAAPLAPGDRIEVLQVSAGG